MAAEVSFVTNRKHQGFMNLLSSAACEWLLIILLFLEAAFSYFLPKFAHYCELETPCPLCSRLDNFFGKKKPGLCWTLLCSNHREEISSLMSCATHGNLANIEGMCEECLASTTIRESSNSGASRVLVGKLWVDVERSDPQNLMMNNHIELGSSGLRTCSCCNKPWKVKSSTENLVELEQANLEASKANLKPLLPRIPGRSRASRRENLKRLRDKFTGPNAHQTNGKNAADKLSHVGYTKIKFNSGSDSEVPVSEDDEEDDDGTVSGGSRSEFEIKIGRGGIPRPPIKNVTSSKQRRQRLKGRPVCHDSNEHKNVKSSSSDEMQSNGLREIEPQPNHKPSPSLATSVMNQKNINASSSDEVRHNGLREVESQSYHKPSPSLATNLMNQKNANPSTNDEVQGNGSREFESQSSHKPSPSLATNQVSVDGDSHTPNGGFLRGSEEASKFSFPRNAALSALTELYSLCEVPYSSVTMTSTKSINVGGSAEKVGTSVSIHVEVPGGPSSNGACHASQPNSQLQTDSCEHVVLPINGSNSSRTAEEKTSLFEDSSSEVGTSFSKDASSKPLTEPSKSRKDDHSSSPALIQASTSDVVGLSLKETTFKPHNKQDESIVDEETHEEQNEDRKAEEIHDKQSDSRKGKETHDKHNVSGEGVEPSSQPPSHISAVVEGEMFPTTNSSEPGGKSDKSRVVDDSSSQAPPSEADDPSPNENGSKPDYVHNMSRKGGDSDSEAPSQASVSEVGGTLSKDTCPRTFLEGTESMRSGVKVVFLKDSSVLGPPDKHNESRKDEDSSNPIAPDSPSVKRNEQHHPYEVVCEIEGESTLDWLKRQIEHDKKVIYSLHKELEAERNAAATAANEAMVMITKLQEEKATLHTEALQFIRMMEEQAEYDMEALHRSNVLLEEREKELQELEDELEFYRSNFDDLDNDKKETSVLENHVADNSEDCPETSDSKLAKISEMPTNTSPSTYEDGKLYIMEFLNKLEEDLRQAYCKEKPDHIQSGLNSDRMKTEGVNPSDSSPDLETLSHPQTEGSTSSAQEKSLKSNGSSGSGTASNDLNDDKSCRALDASEKENVVPDERLEALETDRDFLRRASDLLWNGKDGLHLIQEVANQLKELRKIEFYKR
ncbi:probable myosin-binding protein 4 [Andrographis paniculata]|uniref:probable myosin-binding protein 4 n=1 Tax=Andrographis paniculata TaxID=175694 RepID=UPI0021E82235|nr:probable myosin-binding protein 4 [Andrographis paniculata]XP_051142917.1 probable myosin-binding protein 4 [Andrographis paniculata]